MTVGKLKEPITGPVSPAQPIGYPGKGICEALLIWKGKNDKKTNENTDR